VVYHVDSVAMPFYYVKCGLPPLYIRKNGNSQAKALIFRDERENQGLVAV
jgi:hypothetical protein